MRSPRELADRLRQELSNVVLWAAPPRPRDLFAPSPLPDLPDPRQVSEGLRGTSFPDELRALAPGILAHRFPLLGITIDAGPKIHWRRDYLNDKETEPDYFRRVPYLDAARAGDHKIIWELNRHQHLVALAQLYLFDRDTALLDEIWNEIESWMEDNPFHRGINWSSALEVAFRAMSWIWIFHLVGDEMPAGFRTRLLEGLYQHGRHLEVNLSFYFSPNTHLLGEAVALDALGRLFPGFPRSEHWVDVGGGVVRQELERQVRADGAHFEQSTYYHVYALDMFVFHGILSGAGEEYRRRIAGMADYLAAVMGPARELPFIGDDDGGRWFHPFGERGRFGRASLATCARWLGSGDWAYDPEDLYPQASWWLGDVAGSAAGKPLASRFFPETGMAVMTSGDRHILVDAGPFGPWGAGHSHSDTLSVVARRGSEEILGDSGTYTYVGDDAARNWFRGSGAHSVIRVDGFEQAVPVNPFRWSDHPSVRVIECEGNSLDAECRFQGFTHRRRVRFVEPDLLLIVDDVAGPDGEHEVEQWWRLGSEAMRERVIVPGVFDIASGWRSSVFGSRAEVPLARVVRKGPLPVTLAAAVWMGEGDAGVRVDVGGSRVIFRAGGEAYVFESGPA